MLMFAKSSSRPSPLQSTFNTYIKHHTTIDIFNKIWLTRGYELSHLDVMHSIHRPLLVLHGSSSLGVWDLTGHCRSPLIAAIETDLPIFNSGLIFWTAHIFCLMNSYFV